MEQVNGKDRSPQSQEESENSKFTFGVGSLGTVSEPRFKYESYEVGVSREDSNESNNFVAGERASDGVGGKLVRQLVNETEKQLAYHQQQSEYHEQQAELLKQRLEELKQIPEKLVEVEQIE
ncbi:hypothetical protein H6G81_34780 [Scytonema hofmannii FACHB-248]|uniref:Uncharacterized protein n=1 Tax=Scytonema hofmannii FACHB-248 TaxID=1842502 RepID=A0ABR8H241_9CYAN|nr:MULTISPECIES: hypothetical protein [Nostocales]MBD2609518.1 hypothetical protein [Scytonema hofmannii FACHB-248]